MPVVETERPLTIKQRQRQLREDAILDLAHEIMATQGYAAMTMDDLATQLGISTGTVYQHFASKEELAIGVALRFTRTQEAFFEAQDLTLPAVVRIEQYLRWLIERRFQQKWPDIEAIVYVVRSHGKRRPEVQARLDEKSASLARLVEEAKAQGDIRREISTPVLVHLLHQGVSASSLEALVQTEGWTPPALADALVTLLLDGARTDTRRTTTK